MTKKQKRDLAVGLSLFVILLVILINIKPVKSQTIEVVVYKYYTSYEVREGDTLTSISQKFCDEYWRGTRQDWIEEVCFTNHIDNPDILWEGGYIIVPYYSTEYKP